MAQIEKGTVFGGRYVVQSQVGTGGMATVYRGVDSVLNRTVAIKVMLPQYANDPAFAQRFKQEAQAAAALQNPFIVQVYDWGRDERTGTYYIVMEYLRGTDLKTGIRSHGALAPRKVAQIGAQVCSALEVAHRNDIIHRDVKPQNIMIQPNGDAKVMDFGIARAKNSNLTQTNSVLGTAHYVSPEQAQGKELGPTSDLYSLGVVMYEAATGKLPFEGDDAVTVALKQVSEQAIPPSEINPNIDDGLESIIMMCMEKDPRNRFQSADELRHVLNNYINGRPLGIPSYDPLSADPTSRLGATKTTRMPTGSIGYASQRGASGQRTAAGQRGASGQRTAGTQPLVHQGRGAAGMGSVDPRRSSNSTFRNPREMQEQRRRQDRSSNAVIVAIVGIVAIVLIAVLALTTCNAFSGGSGTGGSGQGTSGGTSGASSQGSGESGDSSAAGGDSTSGATKVTVPDLANYTQQEAKNRLATEGLSVGSVTQETSSTYAVGKVIRTSPAAKTEVASGSSVDLVISSGSDTVSVPDIRNMTESQAQSTLATYGLTAVHDSTLDAYHETYTEGNVVTYTPANKKVAKGTTIRYGLSKGVDPATQKVTLPTLTNYVRADAENILTGLGLTVQIDNSGYSNEVASGSVMAMSPAAGTEVEPGSTVTLTISQGPKTITVPNYIGYSSESARAGLASLNLNCTVDTSVEAPDAASAGTVYYMNPEPGWEVDTGAWITVYAYGSYTPPAPTSYIIPSDIASYSGGVAGVVSALGGMGFSFINVTDGNTTINPADYALFSVVSVDKAGQNTPFTDTVTVYVTQNPVTSSE